ncbi:hypothetical protein [Microbacterium sp. CGR1]|uniref:hypothetical protein n=1 Tax=Microbacterium sp. CGR1 TaxID=1696072 RepID=UPI003DA40430
MPRHSSRLFVGRSDERAAATIRISPIASGSAAIGVLLLSAMTACAPAVDTAPQTLAQTLTITYADGSAPTTDDIDVDGIQCSETQELRSFIGGGDVDGRAAVTVSFLGDQATVAIHLEDDRWFVGSGTTESDDDSLAFDGFEGSVVEQGADLGILGIVDEAATLSGTLTCS